MAMIIVGLAISFMPAAESALCLSSTVAINVISPADVQNLTDVFACPGRGTFDISWYSSATITQTIEISDMKEVTITGVGVPRVGGALADNNGAGAVVNTEFGSDTGMFSVSNGSTLRLNHLVLEGGNAEHGGAISLKLSSSLFVLSCVFANNIAENGGETTGSMNILL